MVVYLKLIRIISCVVCVFGFLHFSAQQLIGSSGTEENSTQGSFTFSIGEPVIETLSNNSVDQSSVGFNHLFTTHLLNCSTDYQNPFILSNNTELFEIAEFGAPSKIWRHEWRVAKIDVSGSETSVKFKHGNSPTSANRNAYNLTGSSNGGNPSNFPAPTPPTSNTNFIEPNTTYKVQARTQFKKPSSGITGMLTSFGKACYVKTPGGVTTVLSNCSTDPNNPIQLQSFNEIIEATLIPTAHSYIFHFFDATGNTLMAACTTTTTAQPHTRQTSLDHSQVQLLDLNTVYEVKVKARIFKKYGGGITGYGESCFIRSPNNGPSVNLTSCENNASNAPNVYDGQIIQAEITPQINNNFEYRYIFKISDLNGNLIKSCTTSNNANRKKLCLKGCPSYMGITNAKLSSNYIGQTLKIEVSSWVKNGYNTAATPPIIIPNEEPCFLTYQGTTKSLSHPNNLSKLTVYPNPNNGAEFYLNASGFEGTKAPININIFDLYGRVVYSNEINSEATHIISNIILEKPLSAGVYLIKVDKLNISSSRKIIVQ